MAAMAGHARRAWHDGGEVTSRGGEKMARR
jgi:hypothetical protein